MLGGYLENSMNRKNIAKLQNRGFILNLPSHSALPRPCVTPHPCVCLGIVPSRGGWVLPSISCYHRGAKVKMGKTKVSVMLRDNLVQTHWHECVWTRTGVVQNANIFIKFWCVCWGNGNSKFDIQVNSISKKMLQAVPPVKMAGEQAGEQSSLRRFIIIL